MDGRFVADDVPSGQAPSLATTNARVRPRRAIPGFPTLQRGRAAPLLLSTAAAPSAMAGQGNGPQPPPRPPPSAARPDARLQQQQNPHARDGRATGPVAVGQRAGRGRGSYGAGRAGDADSIGRQNFNGSYGGGQWGDDGYDAYGDGRYRGPSSGSGGRGYNGDHRQYDSNGGRGFTAPRKLR